MKFPVPLDLKSSKLNVVIETPRGSRNKHSFDEDLGCFKLKNPAGSVSLLDFGCIPFTTGEYGDCLDALEFHIHQHFLVALLNAACMEYCLHLKKKGKSCYAE